MSDRTRDWGGVKDPRWLPPDHPDYEPSPYESMKIANELERQETEHRFAEAIKQRFGMVKLSPHRHGIVERVTHVGRQALSGMFASGLMLGDHWEAKLLEYEGKSSFTWADSMKLMFCLVELEMQWDDASWFVLATHSEGFEERVRRHREEVERERQEAAEKERKSSGLYVSGIRHGDLDS